MACGSAVQHVATGCNTYIQLCDVVCQHPWRYLPKIADLIGSPSVSETQLNEINDECTAKLQARLPAYRNTRRQQHHKTVQHYACTLVGAVRCRRCCAVATPG